jgi:hypothetical protein
MAAVIPKAHAAATIAMGIHGTARRLRSAVAGTDAERSPESATGAFGGAAGKAKGSVAIAATACLSAARGDVAPGPGLAGPGTGVASLSAVAKRDVIGTTLLRGGGPIGAARGSMTALAVALGAGGRAETGRPGGG